LIGKAEVNKAAARAVILAEILIADPLMKVSYFNPKCHRLVLLHSIIVPVFSFVTGRPVPAKKIGAHGTLIDFSFSGLQSAAPRRSHNRSRLVPITQSGEE
jgi:hypothetical protein